MKIFDKIRQVLHFLIEYLLPLRWDGLVWYSKAKRLIKAAVFEDDAIAYQGTRKMNVAIELASGDE